MNLIWNYEKKMLIITLTPEHGRAIRAYKKVVSEVRSPQCVEQLCQTKRYQIQINQDKER